MGDISELQARLQAALDRVGAGVERLSAARGIGELEDLRAALEAERTVNAQLEERVRAIRERQDGRVQELQAEVERLRETLAIREGETERLKAVNVQLRENNRKLREANKAGLADPGLVDEGLEAELAALRAQQSADRAELDDILAELKPLIGESADA